MQPAHPWRRRAGRSLPAGRVGRRDARSRVTAPPSVFSRSSWRILMPAARHLAVRAYFFRRNPISKKFPTPGGYPTTARRSQMANLRKSRRRHGCSVSRLPSHARLQGKRENGIPRQVEVWVKRSVAGIAMRLIDRLKAARMMLCRMLSASSAISRPALLW